MLSVSLAGSDQLGELAGRLREAGRRDLRRELDRELRKQPRRLENAVRAAIPPHIPVGYERAVGTSLRFRTTVRTRGSAGAGVRVTVASGRQIRDLDRGRLRHPVFGRQESPWVTQRIKPGFFTNPAQRVIREVQDGMLQVIQRIAAKIGGNRG
jgi:hypothetical protein